LKNFEIAVNTADDDVQKMLSTFEDQATRIILYFNKDDTIKLPATYPIKSSLTHPRPDLGYIFRKHVFPALLLTMFLISRYKR